MWRFVYGPFVVSLWPRPRMDLHFCRKHTCLYVRVCVAAYILIREGIMPKLLINTDANMKPNGLDKESSFLCARKQQHCIKGVPEDKNNLHLIEQCHEYFMQSDLICIPYIITALPKWSPISVYLFSSDKRNILLYPLTQVQIKHIDIYSSHQWSEI